MARAAPHTIWWKMKIGDTVSVVDDDLGGVITSVHGDTVVFRDEYGFTHQLPLAKVIVRNPDIYENIKIEKKFEYAPPKSVKHNRNHLVLDLHFEKLVAQPADYESYERLLIQKEKLLQTLEFCRKNYLKKLEIIHGIGDGVLQNMVFDVLKSQMNLDFEDDEFFYHSAGSVMVNFK